MADVTPQWLLDLIEERDGHVCAWFGVDTGRLVPQHRQGGMGGRADKHRPSNVVWLDSILNGRIKDDPDLQREAFRRGIAIPLGADPEAVGITHAAHGRVYLHDSSPFVSPAPRGQIWEPSDPTPVGTSAGGVSWRQTRNSTRTHEEADDV